MCSPLFRFPNLEIEYRTVWVIIESKKEYP